MTKNEFLQKLQEELKSGLAQIEVREQINYYDQYIKDEIAKGRTEKEVVEELGDPWAIARTLLDSSGNESYTGQSTSYEARRSGDEKKSWENSAKIHMFGIDTWWKKLLLVLGVIGIIMIIVGVISGIIKILAPIILPLLIVWMAIRILKGKK